MARPPLPRTTSTPAQRPGVRAKEPAHLPLHRRLLFPTVPLEKPLPAIISGAGKRAELDVLNDRIYNLIALILRAYVLSWYPRFSRDRTLLPTLSARIIVPILSPILTGLNNDPDRLVQLFLLDLPNIVRLHWSTYWQARQALLSIPHLYPPQALGDIYHSRLPLPSVAPSAGIPAASEPYRNPVPAGQYILSPLYLTSLTDALLRLRLPPEEYGSPVERSMAREIVGRAVLGGIGTKLGEGWFGWSLVLKLWGSAPAKRVGGKDGSRTFEAVSNLLLRIYGGMVMLWAFTVSVSARYTAAPPTEERYRDCALPWMALGREVLGVDGRLGISSKWGLRLAWGVVEAVVSLLGPLIDRILPHLIRSLLTPSLSFRLIDLLERLLFPLDGYPGPSPPDLTPSEAQAVRNELEDRIQAGIPPHLRSVLSQKDVSALLDPLDDPGCNAHLVGMILDCIVGTLEPALLVPSPVTPEGFK